MRPTVAFLSVLIVLLSGCSSHEPPPSMHVPVNLESLALRSNGRSQGFLQSDRRGSFLFSTAAGALDSLRWTVNGIEVLSGLEFRIDGNRSGMEHADSVIILPQRLRVFFQGGAVATIAAVEGLVDPEAHAISVDLTAPAGAPTAVFHFHGAPGLAPESNILESSPGGVRYLLTTASHAAQHWTVSMIDSLAAAREQRMVSLLESSYTRLPDDTVNAALQWAKLAIDALIVEEGDTLGVAEIPWDGSLDLRSNVQTISALSIVDGSCIRSGAVLRAISRYMDENPRSASYGRIADRVQGGHPTYDGADVAPWFTWEMYNDVTRSNDTSMARAMYPLIALSIDATRRRHVDSKGLMTHGPNETWMARIARGNRAVELQLLWYFQQLVGSYIASFVGDTAAARKYWDGSVTTNDAFLASYGDTTQAYMPDALNADGTRDTTIRANALTCLEMAENGRFRVAITRTAVEKLLTSSGVKGYEGGPVWTWLAGPMTYALTRIDRPDLAETMTRSMARTMLTSGIAGAIPDRIPRGPNDPVVSLRGVAEFVRTINQDYIGVRADLAAGDLYLEPKLPDDWRDVAFSVAVGKGRVTGSYRSTAEGDRIDLAPSGVPRSLRVIYIWMLPNGDAWRGAVTLNPDLPLTLVINQEGAVAFQGENEVSQESKRLLKNFSQHATLSDLHMSN
jgi:hypothetical protein